MTNQVKKINTKELCDLFGVDNSQVVSIRAEVAYGHIIAHLEMRYEITQESTKVNQLTDKCVCGYQGKIDRLEVLAKELYDALRQMQSRRGIHVDDAELVIGSMEKYEGQNNE